MSLSTANIDKVRATAFPAGMLRNGEIVALPGMVLVSWSSIETDKLFQVYVNSQRAGATSHPNQRSLLVEYNHTHTAVIEVVSVWPGDKNTDFSDQLTGFNANDGSHVILEWPRRGILPLASKANVYWNSGSDEIDYDNPLVVQDIWHGAAEKWGWGLDAFGKGDFGYSGTGAIGWERGSFGLGEFGFDADKVQFQSDSLALGRYKFAVRLSDGLGNLDEGEITTLTLSIDPIPASPNVSIEGYDDESDELVLNVVEI